MSVLFRQRNRRLGGQVLAELPVMLIVLFFGFMIPLILFCTLGYRAILLWVSTRAACQAAAKCSTFTSASNIANQTLASQINKNGNITGSGQLYIVIQPQGGGAFTAQSTKLSSPATTSTNVYFVRYSVNGALQPLFPDVAWLGGAGIPGLNAPINLAIASENYFENPSGLNN